MSSVKVQNALVYSLADEIIDEKNMCFCLIRTCKSSNPEYSFWKYDAFCLDSFDSSKYLTEFRVSKEDLPRLAEVLRVPPQFRCPQGTVCSGIEGL